MESCIKTRMETLATIVWTKEVTTSGNLHHYDHRWSGRLEISEMGRHPVWMIYPSSCGKPQEKKELISCGEYAS